ncbi:hypothetical protein [Streptomyces sp. H39-S7]|uniref:hypothetical protein n=1 Tax=Streptomyces sp. H39-S7 TaxID=3004357 RepID=UPI0022AEE046|nr:hypothetical protein [Streptomyces sp. H39-S7]MCZ4118607.1 hypothetical protein [Streptomyces sp. H39-S7]
MTRSTPPIAAALVMATALALTACGGDDNSSKTIPGAQTTPPTPTATTTTAAPTASAQRPTITLPSDVKDVFEGGQTGDPVKDAVLLDNAEGIKAVDAAIVAGKATTPDVRFYYEGEGAVTMAEWVQSFLAHKNTTTGTVRYYKRDVTLKGAGSATLIYCADESKAFNKSRTTGKIAVTPVTKNSYTVYNSRLEKNKQGVWQTIKVISQRGAAQCQP